jgi:hypothetical protein
MIQAGLDLGSNTIKVLINKATSSRLDDPPPVSQSGNGCVSISCDAGGKCRTAESV